MDSSGSGEGSVLDSCEHGDEDWGFLKGGQFLYKLSDY
jgi:hypothetical protein